MSKFQIILLGFFGFFILVAVATFSLYRGGGSGGDFTAVIWGDIPSQDFSLLLNSPHILQDRSLSVNYVEKPAETLATEFTEALATGAGPDLIILTQDGLWKEKAKLVVIPYANISERDFKQTFVEEGELFLDSSGAYALPLIIDPLVLYYNRDLLSAAGLARPMAYWDEIYSAASKLTKKDPALNLTQSAIALGEARNIPRAKEILSLLMLQAGTPITAVPPTGGLHSELNNNFNLSISPAESALDFYTQFSNPAKAFYSWNRSLIDAQTHFTSGDSAYYIGFASELRALKNKNPTLNFAVAAVPQSRVSGKTITFGRLRAVAISRGSKNPAQALAAATKLVARDSARALSEIMQLAPARRDILSARPSDSILSVFYDAAVQSRGWLDPDAGATKDVWNDMIESVTSGRARSFEAINKANEEINELIK